MAAHTEGLLFNDLKELCALTDGNLSRHMTVLSEAGLVEPVKEPTSSRPQTMYRLTRTGRQRFAEYITVLEQVVADAQVDVKAKSRGKDISSGWSPA
ncbi:MAG: transcriptional regulator [Planctomycetaceae bacterium]